MLSRVLVPLRIASRSGAVRVAGAAAVRVNAFGLLTQRFASTDGNGNGDKNKDETKETTNDNQQNDAQKTQEPTNDAQKVADELKSKEEEIARLNGTLATEKEKNTELRDRVVRCLAEIDSVRVRCQKDVDNAKQFGAQKFAKGMLPESALRAVEPKDYEGNDKFNSFYEGVQMMESVFLKGLRENNVMQFCEKGDKFDANFHEALYEVQDPKLTPFTVGVVFRKGYKLSDRVIRPAQVAVVKASPPPATETPADNSK